VAVEEGVHAPHAAAHLAQHLRRDGRRVVYLQGGQRRGAEEGGRQVSGQRRQS
jgi:hypothetical protein